MLIESTDFNRAERAVGSTYGSEWAEVQAALSTLLLHLKASGQKGIKGKPIFDPVGTNEAIKSQLTANGWLSAIPIPVEYNFLGINVDYGKSGVIAEVQFSNYPFLLNNLLRGEAFFKNGITLAGQTTGLVIIVTKAHMFPASNSTLYYEQAVRQLEALHRIGVFTVPLRLVGLFVPRPAVVQVQWTRYRSRYSRTVVSRAVKDAEISPGRGPRSRCRLKVL